MFVFQIKENGHGLRLDQVLAHHEKIQSRSKAKKLILSHQVTVNQERRIAPDTIVKKGDQIAFKPLEVVEPDLKPVSFPLEIHYEDEDLIVLFKPQGVVCHPSLGHWDLSLVHYLLAYTELSQDRLRPGIVHRLDKDTSGLMIVAKNDHTHLALTELFSKREIYKKYLALCYHVPNRDFGTIETTIGRHPIDRKKQAIHEKGRDAYTEWKVIQKFDGFSLIECRIKTGRTHQIRVHLHSIGLPIVGDPLYLSKKKYISQEITQLIDQLEGQLLHASSIGFIHPTKKQRLDFQRHLPRYFLNFLSYLEQ